MDQSVQLNSIFVRPIIRSLSVVILGFLLAPTHLLYSFYQAHTMFRWTVIMLGVAITIRGLFNMLKISVRAIKQPV